MSAETELAIASRSRPALKAADVSQPLVTDALDDTLKTDDSGLMITAEYLLRLIGKVSSGHSHTARSGFVDFHSRLRKDKLQEHMNALATDHLSKAQRAVLLGRVAHRFTEPDYLNPELFAATYGLTAGFLSRNLDTAFSSWPIDPEDMTLTPQQALDLPELGARLAKKAVHEQPYLSEFIVGRAGNAFLGQIESTKLAQKRQFYRQDRREFILAGIGLATLHMQELNEWYADEALVLQQDYEAATLGQQI